MASRMAELQTTEHGHNVPDAKQRARQELLDLSIEDGVEDEDRARDHGNDIHVYQVKAALKIRSL